ncbi:conserved hypothetical protein [Coccidioides posadasii str. Silveira]|uniref:Uncharacterized protein n=1 Tax=Coccidioides posadasii (strain RMSCC 757 / Silveira) TaxID=443226 RepID=E9D1W8_COCPS|nr:conserved hypothetical protein [Coccidioides posadasii str. Silveira]
MGSATVISKKGFLCALEKDTNHVHREIAQSMDSGRFNMQQLQTKRNKLHEYVQELDTQANILVMEKRTSNRQLSIL